jgi:hypothetical protein
MSPRYIPTGREKVMAYAEWSADGCWPWRGGVDPNGYGQVREPLGKVKMAHRFAYEVFVGPIPPDLQLDHVCHSEDESCSGGSACLHRRCVNPVHLEPVTPLQNAQRSLGPGSRTQCPHGHPYNAENTYLDQGKRRCRTCRTIRQRRQAAA